MNEMNTKKSQTREELLMNTIERFNSDNRAEVNDIGQYCTKNGRRCAIGIEVSLAKAKYLEDSFKGSNAKGVLNELPKRLQKMGLLFLLDIQDLHDDEDYWDEEGLSESGKTNANKIIKKHNLKLDPIK